MREFVPKKFKQLLVCDMWCGWCGSALYDLDEGDKCFVFKNDEVTSIDYKMCPSKRIVVPMHDLDEYDEEAAIEMIVAEIINNAKEFPAKSLTDALMQYKAKHLSCDLGAWICSRNTLSNLADDFSSRKKLDPVWNLHDHLTMEVEDGLLVLMGYPDSTGVYTLCEAENQFGVFMRSGAMMVFRLEKDVIG